MFDEGKKKIKITDEKIALRKAENYCVYQERCQQEGREKLYEWGLWFDAVENIIVNLITNNFLNEERFAKVFAGGKFRIKKWGRVKIKLELKKRKISDYCLKKAMKEIEDDDYSRELKKIITETLKKYKSRRPQVRKYQTAKYAISRGYESNLVWEEIKKTG